MPGNLSTFFEVLTIYVKSAFGTESVLCRVEIPIVSFIRSVLY